MCFDVQVSVVGEGWKIFEMRRNDWSEATIIGHGCRDWRCGTFMTLIRSVAVSAHYRPRFKLHEARNNIWIIIINIRKPLFMVGRR